MCEVFDEFGFKCCKNVFFLSLLVFKTVKRRLEVSEGQQTKCEELGEEKVDGEGKELVRRTWDCGSERVPGQEKEAKSQQVI